MEAPDYFNAILGVRAWWIQTAYLRSMFYGGMWEKGRVEEAYCPTGWHDEALSSKCACGLYAFYGAQHFLEGGCFVTFPQGVKGVVSAWGDIELHERGFRAQYMRLEALLHDERYLNDIPNGWWIPLSTDEHKEQISDLASRYGVPLIRRWEIEDFAEEKELVILEKGVTDGVYRQAQEEDKGRADAETGA